MRTEKDFLGELQVPKTALYGIHALRAKDNFPSNIPFQKEWYQAMGLVKLAIFKTLQKFENAIIQSGKSRPKKLFIIDLDKINALQNAAQNIANGLYFESFIVSALQGGAGTSINMNINEIISNVALQNTGFNCGDYHIIDPNEHANIYQSTNDVVPTALRVAVLQLLGDLEMRINLSRAKLEQLEKENRQIARLAYTQMQAAVPSSFGVLFSTYCDALSRDWWRVSKCFERIKQVNLGGGAAGTGLAVPRYFIMNAVQELQNISKQPITRAENLADATANQDVWVEIHAILKAHAINLEKIANDLRLLASDIAGQQIEIQARQTGSSIMPGKINPVSCEYIITISHRIKSNDHLISELSSLTCLDLNAYLPMIGHCILETIKLLIDANIVLEKNILSGIKIKIEQSQNHLYLSPTICTALNPYIGYHAATNLALKMKKDNCTIFEANKELDLINPIKLKEILKTENLIKQGFSLDDINET